jgi:hypothetical protein
LTPAQRIIIGVVMLPLENSQAGFNSLLCLHPVILEP